MGADAWSTAELTFNGDHTGSGHYATPSDAGCTAKTGDKSFTFSSTSVGTVVTVVTVGTVGTVVTVVTVGTVGTVTVLKLDQTGQVLNPTWYIPANASDNGYSLDLDFTDGESGPYLFEPSGAQVADFAANPGQGVAFDEQ